MLKEIFNKIDNATLAVFVGIASSYFTFLMTKKKSNADIYAIEIASLSKAMEMYKGMVEDLKKEVAELREEGSLLREELKVYKEKTCR